MKTFFIYSFRTFLEEVDSSFSKSPCNNDMIKSRKSVSAFRCLEEGINKLIGNEINYIVKLKLKYTFLVCYLNNCVQLREEHQPIHEMSLTVTVFSIKLKFFRNSVDEKKFVSSCV